MARVAFILGEMFEDSEFQIPYERVREAGHEAIIIGTEAGLELTGNKGKQDALTELAIREVDANDFDALVIPGGYSPDKLRTNPEMVAFTRAFFQNNRPVAAVCHAGSMLAEAGVARGRTLTSWPSIRTDLVNAGARWVDREVVEDGNLITSRKPEDLRAFSDALLRHLEGRVPARIDPSRPFESPSVDAILA
jgi:deglycase